MKQPHFLYVYTNSQKLKVDQKFFGWAWPKKECANLKLIKIEQIELTDFLHALLA